MSLILVRDKVVVAQPRNGDVLKAALPVVIRGRVEMHTEFRLKDFFNVEDDEEVFSNTALLWSYPNLTNTWYLLCYQLSGPLLEMARELAVGLGYGQVQELGSAVGRHFLWTLLENPHYLEVGGKDSQYNPNQPIPHLTSQQVPEGQDLGYAKLDVGDTKARVHFRFDRRLGGLRIVNDTRLPSNAEELALIRERNRRQAGLFYERPLKTLAETLV